MTAEQIIAKVDEILVEEFELDEASVVPGATLREDLDLDSLDAVDLIVALEKAFGFRIDEQVVVEMKTVGDIHGYIRDHFGSDAQVEAAAKKVQASA
ncbi:MAG TPA: acyl carrier protein [Myxococcota bacterium]|nr:acyl carrier protein [Myxococcota bacterium]